MSILNKTHKAAGFSLLELALAMIVVGTMVGAYIQFENMRQIQKKHGDTVTALNTVQTAIRNFYFANERYPCPADLTLSEVDANYGEEVCDPSVEFMTGGVPFKLLQMRPNQTLDGYEHKLIYSVSRVKTDSATFNNNGGFLKVRRVAEGTGNVYNAGGEDEEGDFILLSTGAEGIGGYSAGGVLMSQCPDQADWREAENCDGDEVFILSAFARNEQRSVNFYDDVTVFQDGTPSQIWVPDDNGDDIKTQHLLIGIGTDQPQYDVDVVGNLKTESGNLISPSVCDTASNNCFDPDKIGGTGMECNGATAMTGIAQGDTVCNVGFMTTGAGSCGNGSYVIGMDANGGLICSP